MLKSLTLAVVVSHSCKNNENGSKVFLESTKASYCELTKARFSRGILFNFGEVRKEARKGMARTSNENGEIDILAGKQQGLKK